jgi:hypothetical protein
MDSDVKKIIIWTTVAVVVLGLGFGGAYYYQNKPIRSAVSQDKGIQAPKSNTNSEAEPTYTPSQELGVLDSVAKVAVPTLSSETALKFDQLPAELKFLVPDDYISSAVVSSASFTDNTSGYSIHFNYRANLLTTYQFFQKFIANRFDFVDGKRSNQAAILIVENKNYQVEYEMTTKESDITNIVLVIKSKLVTK